MSFLQLIGWWFISFLMWATVGGWMYISEIREGKSKEISSRENWRGVTGAWILTGFAMLGIWLIKNG